MARIRSIKPEIRRSLIVSSWPYPIRWTFVGLLGYLDDSGRGHDNTSLIKAELYPLDDDITTRKLEQHLIAIATNGPLCRYEVAGQRYLHVTSWTEHQRINRPTPSKIPPCPIHEDSVSHSLSGSVNGSRKTHASLTEGSLPRAQARVPAEQGAGSREQGKEQGAGKGSGKGAAAAAGSGGTLEHTLLNEHLAQRAMPDSAARLMLDRIRESLDLAEQDPDTVRAALAEWRRRPGAKPGLLPHLVGDQLARVDADGLDPEAAAYIEKLKADQLAKASAR